MFELRGALAVVGCLVPAMFVEARLETPLAGLLAWPVAAAMFCGAADGWLLRTGPLSSVPGLLKAGFALPRPEGKGRAVAVRKSEPRAAPVPPGAGAVARGERFERQEKGTRRS